MPAFDQAALREAVMRKLAAEHGQTAQAAPQEAESGIGVGPYAALVGGSGADLATTLQATTSGRGVEANPLLKHGGSAGLIAGKAASTAALMWAMKKLAESGHPKIAKVIGYGGGAALSGLAAHNARVGR